MDWVKSLRDGPHQLFDISHVACFSSQADMDNFQMPHLLLEAQIVNSLVWDVLKNPFFLFQTGSERFGTSKAEKLKSGFSRLAHCDLPTGNSIRCDMMWIIYPDEKAIDDALSTPEAKSTIRTLLNRAVSGPLLQQVDAIQHNARMDELQQLVTELISAHLASQREWRHLRWNAMEDPRFWPEYKQYYLRDRILGFRYFSGPEAPRGERVKTVLGPEVERRDPDFADSHPRTLLKEEVYLED